EPEAGGDEEEEADALGEAGEVLGEAAPPHARPLHEGEHGDDAEGDDLHGAELRPEYQRVFAEDDGDGGGGAAGGDPVTPADDEAAVVAEGLADEDVLPAGARNDGAELGERVRAEERIRAADDPDGEVEGERRKLLGDVARRTKNPRSDHVPHRHGETEGHTEDSEETASWTGHRGSLTCEERRPFSPLAGRRCPKGG